MSEQELKEKIARIIAKRLCKNKYSHFQLYGDSANCYSRENFAECEVITDTVDALISAGIGDVSEWKERAENFAYAYNACGNDLAEMERRAEVAERALRNACRNIIADEKDGIEIEPRDEVLYKAYLKQAEKELQEERKDEQFYL